VISRSAGLSHAATPRERITSIGEAEQRRRVGDQDFLQLGAVRRVSNQQLQQIGIVRRLHHGRRDAANRSPIRTGPARLRCKRARSESRRPRAARPWRSSRRATASPRNCPSTGAPASCAVLGRPFRVPDRAVHVIDENRHVERFVLRNARDDAVLLWLDLGVPAKLADARYGPCEVRIGQYRPSS
jgi:hypothetical protein